MKKEGILRYIFLASFNKIYEVRRKCAEESEEIHAEGDSRRIGRVIDRVIGRAGERQGDRPSDRPSDRQG